MPLITDPAITDFANGDTSPTVRDRLNDMVDAIEDLAQSTNYCSSVNVSGESALQGSVILAEGDAGISLSQNDGTKTITVTGNVYMAGEPIREVTFTGDGSIDIACDDLKRVDAYAAAINFEPDFYEAHLLYIPAGSYAYTPYSEGAPYDLRPTLWADSAVQVSSTWYVRIQYRNLYGSGVIAWWAMAY